MERVREWFVVGAVAALILAGLCGSSVVEAGDPSWQKETPTELKDSLTTAGGYYVDGQGHAVPAATNVTTSYYPIEFARTLSLQVSHAPLGNAELHVIPIYDQYTKPHAAGTVTQNIGGYALPFFPTDRVSRTTADEDTTAIYRLDVAGKGGRVGFILNHTGNTTITGIRVQVKGGM